jgi:hypothetical protein
MELLVCTLLYVVLCIWTDYGWEKPHVNWFNLDDAREQAKSHAQPKFGRRVDCVRCMREQQVS